MRRIALVAAMTVVPAIAMGQTGGRNTGSGSVSPSGIRSDGGLGNGASFRGNNSTFGMSSGLQPPTAGNGANPFTSNRSDAASEGRVDNSQVTSTNRNRNRNFTSSGQSNRSNRSNGNQQGQSSPRSRTVTVVSFDSEKLTAEKVVENSKLALTPTTLPSLKSVNVSFTEGVAVLTGSVANEREKRLAAAMLALEPGVRKVDNQLTIAGGK